MNRLRKIFHAPALYPVAACYVAAVTFMSLVASRHIGLERAIFWLGFISMAILFVATEVEIQTTRALLAKHMADRNEQHENLCESIDELIAFLASKGLAPVPEKSACDD